MNFFLQIHRSIVDPSFYEQVIDLPAGKVFSFLFKIIIITVLFVALTHTFRIIERKNGLPAILPALFPGMVITGNKMYTSSETSYVVNPAFVKDFISVLYDVPPSLFHVQDSTIVVDTRTDFKLDKKTSAGFFMTIDTIYIHIARDIFFRIPYSALVKENETVRIDREGVSGYLRRQLPKIIIFLFPYHLMMFISIIVTSIFFLAFAAFILSVGQTYRFKMMLKMAVFAVSPLAIERVLSSLAGVKIVWMSHIAIFISLVIVYRANRYLSNKNNKTSPGENE